MTGTFILVRELGWSFLEKLAAQKVMQVQSSTDPPKKLALGERAVMGAGKTRAPWTLSTAWARFTIVISSLRSCAGEQLLSRFHLLGR